MTVGATQTAVADFGNYASSIVTGTVYADANGNNHPAANAHAAVRNQPLKLRSRVVGKHRDQHAIEPLTIGVGGDLELERHGPVRLCRHAAALPSLIGFDGSAARQPDQHDQAERREDD